MILVPIKNLQNAKQRLSPLLTVEERRALAQAMLEDVLHTLGRWQDRPPVALVTNDPLARELGEEYAFDIIQDKTNVSETDAISMATVMCLGWGAESTLVIPADIPLVSVSELQQVLEAAPERGSVLVPSADGRGSNAVYRKPGGLFPLRFGNDSFLPHRAAAKATGYPCVELRLPGIALDVDTPADLKQLLAEPGDSRAQRLVREWHVAENLLAAHP
ncbi:MAG TPA: 2-phospho-L-lactate guanylyltransferase [Terriglobales bacterium]|nr:2-phospho-L-lactate guanylyltransferase [Terriglobales bacterium]